MPGSNMLVWTTAFLFLFSAAGSLGASMKGVDRSVHLMVRDLTEGMRSSSESVAVPHLFTLEGKNTVLGRLISQKLISELAKSGKLMPVERDFIFKLTDEMKLGMTGLVEPGTVQQVGKIFGAEYVIVGTMEHFEDEIEVSARLVRTETSRIEKTVDVSFEADPELVSLFNKELKLNRLQENSLASEPEKPVIKLDQEYFEARFRHDASFYQNESVKEREKKIQDEEYYRNRNLELKDVERKNEEKNREIAREEKEKALKAEKESKEWQEKMERAREKDIENLNRRNIIIFMPR